MCKISRYIVGLLIICIHKNQISSDQQYFGIGAKAAVIERYACDHNGSRFADGSFVPTLEPCLNCKCNRKTLVCSLKICPEMPVPPPRGCVLVQKRTACCPFLSCLKLHEYFNNALSRRIASYLDYYEKESIDRVVSDNFLQKRSDDDDFDSTGEICVQNGTVYKSGSAMSSSSLCSYCYCIGGKQKCIKPKCMLPLDGCKPIFVDSTCCPVRYDCSSKSGVAKFWQNENRKQKTNNKHYQRMSQNLQHNHGCQYDNNFYMEGQKIPSDINKPCDICFCIRGKKKCAPKKCAPALRSCIPVIPKGHCCPSSYECGPTMREWDRAYQSRQIGLFSWILGSSEDLNNKSSEINTKKSVSIKPAQPIGVTSEKTIFDVLKAGLDIIDSTGKNEPIIKNETKNSLKNFQKPSEIKIITSKKREKFNESLNKETEDEYENNDNINLFDLFIQTVTNVSKPPVYPFKTATSTSTTTTTTISPLLRKDESEEYKDYGVSFFDIFLGKTEKNITIQNSVNFNKTEPFEFDYLSLFNFNDNETYDNDYLSISDSTAENDSSNDSNVVIKSTDKTNLSTTDTLKLANGTSEKTFEAGDGSNKSQETTSLSIIKEDSIESNETFHENSGEEYFDSEERNLSTFSNEDYSTEGVQVGSFSTEIDSLEEISTIKHEYFKNEKNANEIITKSNLNLTTTKLDFQDKVSSTFKPKISKYSVTTQSVLDQTYANNINKKNYTEENQVKPLVKNKVSFFTTVIDELQSFIRKTTNITTVQPNTSKPQVDVNFQNSVNAALITVPPFKKIKFRQNLTEMLNGSSIKSINREEIILNSNKTITNMPTENIFAKTENKHLGSQLDIVNKEYGYNTLPPSLPNLEIIPFLPIDALPIKEKDEVIPTYSSITERYGSGENIWSNLKEDSKPFIKSDGLPLSYMNSNVADGVSDAIYNRFSPPKETEGGFVPKHPIVDEGLYYGTELLTELTTINPYSTVTHLQNMSRSTVKLIDITSTNPFKDVIKTEHPPNLEILIEDKENQFSNKHSQNHEDNRKIHITTDVNYNFDIDSNLDNVIQFANINFENASFSENSNFLAESFPLDRHQNVSFTESNPHASNEFTEINPLLMNELTKVDKAIENKLNQEILENDVFSENFPHDRYDNSGHKQISNSSSEKNAIMNADYEESENDGIGSFLDYFLNENTNYEQNLTISTIPPFKIIPVNLSLLPKISSETINGELLTDLDIKSSTIDNKEKTNYQKSKESNKSKQQEPFSLPDRTASENNKISAAFANKVRVPDPFKGLPGLMPSYQVKLHSENNYLKLDPFLTKPQKEPFIVGAYKLNKNQTNISNMDPYIVNPIKIEVLNKQEKKQKQQEQREQHNNIHAEIFSKQESKSNITDPVGILKLAGCNIYGRMYRVGRIISELSNDCFECKCTEVGVSCISLECITKN